jgi:hypothetical protein
MKTNTILDILIVVLLIAPVCVARSQPIIPVMSLAVDTNAPEVETKSATLSWNRNTNALLYRWTNWNVATNQGGWTTATNTPIRMALGTNRSAVRAEAGTNISAWSSITNLAAATNAVGITGLQTRTMRTNGAAWSGYTNTGFGWVAADNFRQEWVPVIAKSNWWRLDQ